MLRQQASNREHRIVPYWEWRKSKTDDVVAVLLAATPVDTACEIPTSLHDAAATATALMTQRHHWATNKQCQLLLNVDAWAGHLELLAH